LTLTNATETEFHVPRAGTITGRVVGLANTLASLDWQVRTYPGQVPEGFGLTPATATPDPDGTYRLERLAPGDYTIHCFSHPDSRKPTVSVKVTVREGEDVTAPDIVVKE